jgi:hypothetical protein
VPFAAASCADKTMGPSQVKKVVPAGLLGIKAFIEGGLVFGKVLGNR